MSLTQEDIKAIADIVEAKLSHKITPMLHRMDSIDRKLSGIEGRIVAIDGKISSIDSRLERIEEICYVQNEDKLLAALVKKA